MEYLDLFLVPLAAALDWWTMFWSANGLFLQILLGVIFVRLLFRFILEPLMKGDAGSDRADQHPRRK